MLSWRKPTVRSVAGAVVGVGVVGVGVDEMQAGVAEAGQVRSVGEVTGLLARGSWDIVELYVCQGGTSCYHHDG